MAKRQSKRKRRWYDGLLPRHTISVEMTAHGWSGYQVECLLRRYGILIKDRFVSTKEEEFSGPFISLSVQRWRANQAEYILIRAGVPVLGPLFNEQNAKFAPKPGEQGSISPGGWGHGRLDFMTHVIDFLTPILGFTVGDYGHDLPVESRKGKSLTGARRTKFKGGGR